MIVKTIHVQHFRSLFDESIDCSALTALVGRNGTGKSAFLKAIELFYAITPRVDGDDYYNREITKPIEIAITFKVITDAAKEKFASYMEGDELTVVRVITWGGGKPTAKLHGSRLQARDFVAIREASTAAAKKEQYEILRRNSSFSDLPAWRNQAQAVEALQQWEASNTAQLTRLKDDGQFFGFTEVAQGYLGRFTRLLPVHAVRDASADAEERKGSVLTDLMDLVVRSVIAQKEAVITLKQTTQRQYEEILNPNNLTELTGLSGELTRTLQTFVPNAEINLIWQPLEAVSIPLPKADVRLVEDEFESSVDRTGHGLQRAFLMTLLQHLARAQMPSAELEAASQQGGIDGDSTRMPNLILSIEEPELYQHPNRQRHLAAVLMKLASGTLRGVADKTQVLYATHSPFFVGIDRIDQVRLLRKTVSASGSPKVTSVVSTTLDQVAGKVWEANGSVGTKYTGETLRPRLQSVMTPWMSEGFFADCVVLVEGEDDRAAILGAGCHRGVDFEAMGVSIIPCGGKTNIDRPMVIFRQLGIPVYVIWDADKGDREAKAEDNHRLLRLVGSPVNDWPEGVYPNYACFENCLEATLKQELGEDDYHRWLSQCQEYFVITKKKHAIKNPAIIARILILAAQAGRSCRTIDSIIDSIQALLQTDSSVLAS